MSSLSDKKPSGVTSITSNQNHSSLDDEDVEEARDHFATDVISPLPKKTSKQASNGSSISSGIHSTGSSSASVDFDDCKETEVDLKNHDSKSNDSKNDDLKNHDSKNHDSKNHDSKNQASKNHASKNHVDSEPSDNSYPEPQSRDGNGDAIVPVRKTMIEKDYDIKYVLGTGAFSEVKQAVNRTTKRSVAIKIVAKTSLMSQTSLDNEIAVLRKIKHPNIVQLYEIYSAFKNLGSAPKFGHFLGFWSEVFGQKFDFSPFGLFLLGNFEKSIFCFGRKFHSKKPQKLPNI